MNPLYNFQKEDNNKRELNKNKFIEEHYDELGFSKRYISPADEKKFVKKYTINKEDLEELVNEANDKFIESTSISISKDFDHELSVNEFFDDKLCKKLKEKYRQGDYDFYEEIGCDKKINERNIQYKSKIISNFKEALNYYEFIDETIYNELKSKFNNFEYFSIEKSEFTDFIVEKNTICKKSKMSAIFDEFKKELEKYEYIDEKISHELKLKFNNFNYKYSNESDFYDLIEKRNKFSIKSQSEMILKEFDSTLNSCENVINENDRLKLKSKYNKNYYNFYDELNFDKKIDKHNDVIRPIIIQRILSCEDGYISDSRLSVLKTQYDDQIMNWDFIIPDYNNSFKNNKASSEGLFSLYTFDFGLYKSRLSRNSAEKIGFDKYKTHKGVYYLFNYVSKKKRYGYSQNEIKLSLGAWKFKDGYEYAIDFFTEELIDAIFNLSNNVIKDNIDSVALVSVPPSKVYNNSDAAMRKSIYRIKNYYDSHQTEFDKEIIDYGNLLYRFKNVPTSHIERQAEFDEHIESIVCTKRDLSDENMAFIIMDDITTRGVIMNACKNILVKHGANSKNIYKLAIYATVGWR